MKPLPAKSVSDGGSRPSASPNAIASRPTSARTWSRRPGGRTRPPAHAHSARDWWSFVRCESAREDPALAFDVEDISGLDLGALRSVVLAHLGVLDAIGIGGAVDVEFAAQQQREREVG